MTLHRSNGYGLAARVLHWLTALAILAAIALGLIMTNMPAETEADVARLFQAFSIHKTIGVTALAIAVLRIFWTFRNPVPGPLHPERRVETWLARLVHGLLWIGLIALPLTGWLYHSVAPGFAPILWPFGQSLPFVAPNDVAAPTFRAIHGMAAWFILAIIALHVLGALKHVVIDKDATLARMTKGTGPAVAPAQAAPAIAVMALAIWIAVIVLAVLTAPEPETDPFAPFDDIAPLPLPDAGG
ncbi:MAG: cytochrome b [Rhodobacteraceae bacterium]|nr:cytochrome b [Paracoccaceae bacterium]